MVGPGANDRLTSLPANADDLLMKHRLYQTTEWVDDEYIWNGPSLIYVTPFAP